MALTEGGRLLSHLPQWKVSLQSNGMKFIKQKSILVLSLSQSITWLGNSLQTVIFNYYLYQITKSTIVLGNSLVCSLLPVVMFSTIVGYIVDKYSKKRILIFSDIARSVVVIFIPFLVNKNIIYAFLIQFILSSLSLPFNIAQKSIIIELMERQYILKANGILTTIKSLSSIIGPLIAAYLISKSNMNYVFYFNSATFILSAFFNSLLKYKHLGRKNCEDMKHNEKHNRFNIKEYIDVLFSLISNRAIKNLFFLNILITVIISANNVLTIIWVNIFLKGGAREYQLMSSCSFLGLFIGSFLLFKQKSILSGKNTINVICLILSFSLILFSNIKLLVIIYFLRILYATSYALADIIINAQFQTSIDKAGQGKAFSVIELIDSVTSVITIYTISYLSKNVKPNILILAIGLLFSICIILRISMSHLNKQRLRSTISEQN